MKKKLKRDLTQGNVPGTMLRFAVPMIMGNMLQQLYNVADTLIVGKVLGVDALAAVGSAYALMTFLTSVLIGLCMGSGAAFSFYFGRGQELQMKECMKISFVWTGGITIALNGAVLLFLEPILILLQTPPDLFAMMKEYTGIVFGGICFVFLYNYFAYLLRAVGNSFVPLYFLGASAGLNILLDILFVAVFHWGIGSAAAATVISQVFAGAGIGMYTWWKEPSLHFWNQKIPVSGKRIREVLRFSTAASVQQSVMNFGILLVQGLVNSFGAGVMAAFAAGVKIDTFAYMPAQEFGNAFSLFISQNFGAGKKDRVEEGTRWAVGISAGFCLCVSFLVCFFAEGLMGLFVEKTALEIIRTGAEYLRIEGAFYWGIGILFLLYGYCRGINKPEMALVLTIISLGTRVLLAYMLAPLPAIGVRGIWSAVPVGWILADITGMLYIRHRKQKGIFQKGDNA